jgi:16S rRNA (uracil1498-N3)-methyltransferase
MKTGDLFEVVDGKGNRYTTEITRLEGKSCEVRVLERTHEPLQFLHRLHMAIAPTKQIDRLEWFLEKATEIGVQEFTPIWCSNSERKQVKTDRLEKILISAMKQSKQAYLPVLNEPCEFKSFVSTYDAHEKYIAHCYEGEKKHLKHAYKGGDVIVLIGPEGDFTPEEVQLAIENKFAPVSLGVTRLRTETAGLAACQTIQLHHV